MLYLISNYKTKCMFQDFFIFWKLILTLVKILQLWTWLFRYSKSNCVLSSYSRIKKHSKIINSPLFHYILLFSTCTFSMTNFNMYVVWLDYRTKVKLKMNLIIQKIRLIFSCYAVISNFQARHRNVGEWLFGIVY